VNISMLLNIRVDCSQCIFQDFEFEGVNRVSEGGQHLVDNYYFISYKFANKSYVLYF